MHGRGHAGVGSVWETRECGGFALLVGDVT